MGLLFELGVLGLILEWLLPGFVMFGLACFILLLIANCLRKP